MVSLSGAAAAPGYSTPPRGTSPLAGTPCLTLLSETHPMHPAIRLRCPGCNARIKAPIQLSGQMRNCPQCNRPLVVKMKSPEDSEPMLLQDDVPTRRRLVDTF